jgi:glucosyl-3-phosphoglycerate synthase
MYPARREVMPGARPPGRPLDLPVPRARPGVRRARVAAVAGPKTDPTAPAVNASLPHRDAGLPAPERSSRLAAWSERNSLSAAPYTHERLLELKRATVSVVLPAREVAETIDSVVGSLAPLTASGLVDELVVVDAASADGTAAIAGAHGAAVLQESTLMPSFGRTRGKGDALWRGLAATSGEVVVYADTDTRNFSERFVLGLLGPLLERPELEFVKGTFRRPFKVDEVAVPDAGGRVTELVARPLLNLFIPELGAFGQPLAGETAARRELLESLPYPVGYGVEIAIMIDVARRVGVDVMAQVDLDTRQNRHQPLRNLSAMAFAVLGAAGRRFGAGEAVAGAGPPAIAVPSGEGLEVTEVSLLERPPLASVPVAEREAARAAARAAAGAAPRRGRGRVSPPGFAGAFARTATR